MQVGGLKRKKRKVERKANDKKESWNRSGGLGP